jgi:translation initiation factor 1
LEVIRLRVEKSGRCGKTVTLLEGFTRRREDLLELARELKGRCGTGGTVKDGRIEIQGDFREAIGPILEERLFRVRGL